MKKTLLPSFALLLIFAASAFAQTESTAKAVTNNVKDPTPATAITATTSPMDLARAALAAQGGEKFRNLKSMVLRGSADLYAPNSTRAVPGGFVLVIAGDKLMLDVNAQPIFSLKQIFDGQRSFSSIPGVDMPPASKFGLPVLAKFDQPGYTVSALPDNKKKQRSFRIVDSEGNTNDFYLDTATGRVTTCLIPYNGFVFGIENSKYKDVEGVLVPFEFSWRLETSQGAYFAEYKVKDVKLNQPIGDDVFAMPN